MTGISGIGAISSVFGPVSSTGADSGSDFSGLLKNAVNQVTSLQADAGQQVSSLVNGTGGDVGHVMISVEKADVAFQLMMQVRNKIVSAYQDVEKMQF